MFKVNDLVVYENGGVCSVEEIGSPDFVKNEEVYYTLQPIFDKAGTIYVKVQNDRHVLRPIISKDESKKYLDNISNIEPMYSDNDKQRDKEFKEAIRSCECKQWFSMLKGIIKERKRREAGGKKLNMSDDRNMQKVGKLLTSEYSAVLEIPFDEARAMIEGVVG